MMFNVVIIDKSIRFMNGLREITERTRYFNDVLTRKYGPAHQEWYYDGSTNRERWYMHGELHRIDGPAYIEWYYDGVQLREQWYIDGKRHRVNGPAYLEWYYDGSTRSERWYMHGELHRIDGPADQIWFPEIGRRRSIAWYNYGKLHRIDGPAYLEWDTHCILVYNTSWLYGIQITAEINKWASKMDINDIMNMTPDEISIFKLTWGQ